MEPRISHDFYVLFHLSTYSSESCQMKASQWHSVMGLRFPYPIIHRKSKFCITFYIIRHSKEAEILQSRFGLIRVSLSCTRNRNTGVRKIYMYSVICVICAEYNRKIILTGNANVIVCKIAAICKRLKTMSSLRYGNRFIYTYYVFFWCIECNVEYFHVQWHV